MKTFYKIFIAIIFSQSCFLICSKAQGIIAGEITYEHLTGLTYKFNVPLYLEQSSPDSILMINWEDSSSSIVYPSFSFGTGTFCNLNFKKNLYTFFHTYGGFGNYTVTLSFLNRISGIVNVPYSDTTLFTLRASLNIVSSSLGNNSPVIPYIPWATANIDSLLIYNPFVNDVEGDSLSYMAMPVLDAGGIPVSGYILPPASNYFGIDSITGDLLWDTPIAVGNYSVGYFIKEWRSGFYIGSVWREMLICVNDVNGVSELFYIDDDINVYPNPVRDQLTVICHEISNKSEIEIYNVLGESVYTSQLKLQKSRINVSILQSGVYFVEVRNGKDISRKKIVKE